MSDDPAAANTPDSEKEQIRILASPTPNPASLKFTVDRPLMENRTAQFRDQEEAAASSLGRRIWELGGMTGIFVAGNFVTVSREDPTTWKDEAKNVGRAIREHIWSGEPVLPEGADDGLAPRNDDERKILAVLEEVRPYVQGDGGDIIYAGYEDGIVQVVLQGACAGCPSSTATLRQGIETRLKAAVPSVRELVSV
ncbi:MAG: NifU family protein [Planctomycetota bacterium]|jgi:Fe-S cluster biogenesis protein NfuA